MKNEEPEKWGVNVTLPVTFQLIETIAFIEQHKDMINQRCGQTLVQTNI